MPVKTTSWNLDFHFVNPDVCRTAHEVRVFADAYLEKIGGPKNIYNLCQDAWLIAQAYASRIVNTHRYENRIGQCCSCDRLYCSLCHSPEASCSCIATTWSPATKLCPSCFVECEKDGGCNHVFCSACSTRFDWRVLTITEPSLMFAESADEEDWLASHSGPSNTFYCSRSIMDFYDWVNRKILWYTGSSVFIVFW